MFQCAAQGGSDGYTYRYHVFNSDDKLVYRGETAENSFRVPLEQSGQYEIFMTAVDSNLNVSEYSRAAFSFTADPDYMIVDGVITKYWGTDTEVEVPSAIFGDTVTAIGEKAFADKGVTDLTLPGTITSLDSKAFDSCSARIHCAYDSAAARALSSIGRRFYALDDSSFALNYITGADGEEKLQLYSYTGAETAVMIPAYVQDILTRAFYDNDTIVSVSIPDSVKNIPVEAFRYCDLLETLTLHVGLESIGNSAFRDCGSLTDIYYDGTAADWSAIEIEKNNDPLNSATIHFPFYTVSFDANGGSGAPESQSGNIGASLTLSGVVPKRDGCVFLGWASAASAVEAAYQPGDSFTADEDKTLFAVWARPDLILPAYLTEIEDEAFLGGAFTCVLLPEGLTRIGARAFAECTKLRQIIFPNGDIEVAEDFISGCSEYPAIVAPRGSAVAEHTAQYLSHICPPEPDPGRWPGVYDVS